MDKTPAEDRAFERFRTEGDAVALAEVFDRTAPALLAAARSTVGDRHLAEDLLQQTFVAAIEARDDWDGERRVLPWLMGVLANRARNLRRREQRRSHEPLVEGEAVGVPGFDPQQVAADRELDQVMRDAIDELPDPYGTVIDMHVRHGLTAAEIARSLRRPAGTVRTQIVRGSRMLRAALPTGFTAAGVALALAGDALAAARSRVLEHAHQAGAITARAAVSGAVGAALPLLVMNKFVTIFALAVALALSVAFAWDAWEPASAPPAASPDTPAVAPAEQSAAEDAGALQPLVRMDAAPVSTVEPTPQLVVRVLQDWDGAPANLVRVEVHGNGDRITQHGTNREGVAACGDLAAAVEVALPDFGLTAPAPADGSAELEFRVPARLEVAVRVVDAAGAPVAGAELATFRGLAAELERVVLATTDVDGLAKLRTAQGFLSVRAAAAGYLPSGSRLMTARRAPSGVVTLKLGSPAVAVRLAVREGDGKPAADAVVQVFLPERRRMRPLWARTGADGIAMLDLPEERAIVFVARGSGPAARFARVDLPAGPRAAELPIRLEPAASLRGVARDEAGKPAAGVEIQASWRDAQLPTPLVRWWRASATTASDGSYTIEGLVPGGMHVEAVGSDVATDLEVEAGVVGAWDPVVPVPSAWQLTLVDAEGAALSGWFVDLVGAPGSPQAITDERGQAVFDGLGAESVRVTATAPLRDSGGAAFDVVAAASWDEVRTDAARKLVVTADRMPSSRLTGVALGADGMPDGKARVRVLRRLGGRAETVELGCDADGRFAYGPTVAGTVTVAVVTAGGTALRADLQLQRGRTLDLGRVFVGADASLDVTLHLTLQRPVVELRLGQGGASVPFVRGEGARWRSPAALPPGDYTLVVRDGDAVVREQSVTLVPGEAASVDVH